MSELTLLVLIAAPSCLLGFVSGSWLTGLMDRQYWRRWNFCPTCNRLEGEQDDTREGVSAGQAGEQERAEQAKRALSDLRAAVKALADEWDEAADKWPYAVWHDNQKALVRHLHELLAETDADDGGGEGRG